MVWPVPTSPMVTSTRSAGSPPITIVIDKPALDDQSDPWVAIASRTKELLTAARTAADKPYEAQRVLTARFPGREIVQLNIDALAAGGGSVHCARQQPSITDR